MPFLTFPLATAPAAATLQRGRVQRELVAQPDRMPLDRRVDLPEIQESYRVSFSDAVRAEFPGQMRDLSPDRTPAPLDSRLKIYQDTAAL
ncbi:MAG: hypothetical protein WC023_08780 [Rhodocyclaceae bacterium]